MALHILLLVLIAPCFSVSPGFDAQPPVDAQRCENGDMRLGRTCYYIENMREMPWRQARAECLRKKGKLARGNDGKKTKHLDEYLLSMPGGRWNAYWISPHRVGNTNEFVFSDGNEKVTGAKWDDGEPNNEGGQENCVSCHSGDSQFVWNDLGCNINRKYICEIAECPEDCRLLAPVTMSEMNASTAITTRISISSYDIQTTTSDVTVTSTSAAVNDGDEETATTTQTLSSTTDKHAESACSRLQVLVTMVTSLYAMTVVCIEI